jgi:DNA-binding transcriptional LysR family regulator
MSRRFEHLLDLEVFVRAAEVLSFTQAAKSLSMTPAAVSRAIQRLEGKLAASLFLRSTRRMSLTDDGRLLHQQANAAFSLLRDAEQGIAAANHKQRGKKVSGTVRVSVSTTYGHHALLPALPAFAKAHPLVKLEVHVSNRNVDFISEGFDAAIRLGALPDSGLLVRQLRDAPLGLFASPAYVKAHGSPNTMSALRTHTTIPFLLPSTGRVLPWLLGPSSEAFVPSANITVADDVLGCVSLAVHGLGIVQMYDFVAAPWLKSKQLVEVGKALRGASRPFSLLLSPQRAFSPAVRAFVEFITSHR